MDYIYNVFLNVFDFFNLWIVNISSMSYKYAFLGIPIFLEFPLINEMGLGFGGNSVGLTKKPTRFIDEGKGISTYLMLKLTMMNCRNVSEVIDFWKSNNRASGKYRQWPHIFDNSAGLWCDIDNNILCIEQTHNYFIAVFRNSTDVTNSKEDIIWHSNHHQWLNPNLTGSIYPEEDISSKLRAERAHMVLIENYGNITIDVCKQICRDYYGRYYSNRIDSANIWSNPDEKDLRRTIISWIIEPKKYMVHITSGSPIDNN